MLYGGYSRFVMKFLFSASSNSVFLFSCFLVKLFRVFFWILLERVWDCYEGFCCEKRRGSWKIS